MRSPKCLAALQRNAFHLASKKNRCYILQSIKKTTPLQLGAIAAWVVLTLVICIRAAHAPKSRSVYPVYTRAAHNWIAGSELYANGIDFRYSPPVAAVFVPLAILPDSVGAMLWRLISISGFLLALAWWIRSLLPPALERDRIAALFLLVIPIAAASINNGQVNPLLIALLMATVCAAANEMWTLACVFVVLAAALKVYPAALGLLLLLLFPRRIAVRLLIVSLALVLASFFLRNPDYVLARYQEWIHALQTDHRDLARIDLAPTDFRLLLRRTVGTPPELLYASIQAGAALFIAAFCLYMRSRLPRRELLLLLFGLACSWMLLFGPATEGSTIVLIAPTAAWIVLAFAPERSDSLVGVAGYGLLLASQIVGWFPVARTVQSWGLAPLGTLLVFLSLIAGAWRK